MSRIDDQVLIDRAQKGDRSAFNSLVTQYEERAYKFAYRLTRDPELAADVVADAFVRVFTALKNFRGQSAFTTWLYRIVTNCYLDRKKRDKEARNVSLNQPVGGSSSEVVPQYHDESDGPSEIAERDARELAVQKALEQMPEYQQAMLVMYHVESLSYEDISAALDLPIGTVKSRLNRARVALREILEKDLELFQIG
ncbi:sigma-70 family RNA polymerase sigma factor [Kamptonema cortianum]|nr:sigma-70 family RNA polymerase sigma factor [Geitlerinema splendidum]MDK3155942.1 sigma-70 family RNA polymerase sigma factor [Kamptonema cortianum]